MLISYEAKGWRWGLVLLSMIWLLASFMSSVAFGQYAVSLSSVWQSFWHYDPTSIDHVVVHTTRLSRAVVACTVGAALAVSGVLMQTLTRNPLASPAIFGVNAGAVFFIVLFTQLFSVTALSDYLWIAFLGAALAGGLVYGLGSLGHDGLSPVRIVLAGAAITALFSAFTQGVLVLGQEGLDSVLFWMAGSVSGRELTTVWLVLPYVGIGLLAALLLSPHMNILLSGDDIAKGLGQNTLLIKVALSVLIIGLAGGAVALAGNIGFIGLVVPHMVRALVGNDHKWLLPLAAFWGSSLLLLSDVVSRFVLSPEEVPIGVVTALIGTPFFIYLARKGSKHG